MEDEKHRDLNLWVGKEAFGLGCSISNILVQYGVRYEDREECLAQLMNLIRQWSEKKGLGKN